MKLSHKIVMVSAAALMAVSPVVAGQGNLAQAATSKSSKTSSKSTKTSSKNTKSTKSAKTSKKSTSSKKTTANTANGDSIVLANKAYVYLENGKRNTNYKVDGKKWSQLGKGAKLNAFGTKTIDGEMYYYIGNSSYIKASDVATVNGKKVSVASTSSSKTSSSKSEKTSSTKTSSSKASSKTSKKTTKKATKKVKAKLAKVNHNAFIYDKNGKRIKSAGTLKKNSEITYVGTMSLDDTAYYNLGNGRYVKQSNVDPAESLKLVKNAFVYDKNGKRNKAAGVLKKDAKIESLGTKTIKGKTYYNIGGGRFIKAGNVEKTDEEPKAENTYIKLVKNSIVYNENGEAYSPEILFTKGADYQAYAAKQINGKWFYQVGNDQHNQQWIRAINAYVEAGPTLINDPSFTEPSPSTPSNSTDTIVTLLVNAPTYDNKGKVIPNQSFAAGYRLRVTSLTWIWNTSENKAEEFYKIASDSNSYIKASDVGSLSGTTLVVNNTPEQAQQDSIVATEADKAGLYAAIAKETAIKNSAKYSGSSADLRSAYDKAIDNGRKVAGSSNSSLFAVKSALDAINKAEAALNGQTQQTTTTTTDTNTANSSVNNQTSSSTNN